MTFGFDRLIYEKDSVHSSVLYIDDVSGMKCMDLEGYIRVAANVNKKILINGESCKIGDVNNWEKGTESGEDNRREEGGRKSSEIRGKQESSESQSGKERNGILLSFMKL